MAQHDFTKQWWGHSILNAVEAHEKRGLWPFRKEIKVLRIFGVCEGIRMGDEILIKMQSGKVAKFGVRSIKYHTDPADSFNAELFGYGYLD